MRYYTIKEIEEIAGPEIHEVRPENKWVVIVLENGTRIKIKNY